MTDTSILFEETAIGPVGLRNRMAVAPMTRVSATEDGRATDQMARYYGLTDAERTTCSVMSVSVWGV